MTGRAFKVHPEVFLYCGFRITSLIRFRPEKPSALILPALVHLQERSGPKRLKQLVAT